MLCSFFSLGVSFIACSIWLLKNQMSDAGKSLCVVVCAVVRTESRCVGVDTLFVNNVFVTCLNRHLAQNTLNYTHLLHFRLEKRISLAPWFIAPV